MNKKIKELKKAIENSSINYTDLEDYSNELTLIQLYASESVTFEIKAENNCFSVIRIYHSEETDNTFEDNQTFNSVKEILDYID